MPPFGLLIGFWRGTVIYLLSPLVPPWHMRRSLAYLALLTKREHPYRQPPSVTRLTFGNG